MPLYSKELESIGHSFKSLDEFECKTQQNQVHGVSEKCVMSPAPDHSDAVLVEDSRTITVSKNRTTLMTKVNQRDSSTSSIIERGASMNTNASGMPIVFRKNDISTQNGGSTITFQLHIHPGPLGLNIKPRGTLGFEVIHVRCGSQCTGKVKEGDYLVSIDDLVLYDLTNEYVINYLNTRISTNKTITVSRRNASLISAANVQSNRFVEMCNLPALIDQETEDHGSSCNFSQDMSLNCLESAVTDSSEGELHDEPSKEVDHLNNTQDGGEKTNEFPWQTKRLYSKCQENLPVKKKYKVAETDLDCIERQNKQVLQDGAHRQPIDIFQDLVSSYDLAFDPSLYTQQELLKFKELSKSICNEMELREHIRLDEIERRICFDGDDKIM
jgi:hypothetical protein